MAAKMWLLAALAMSLFALPAAAAKATHSTALYKQFFPAWDEMLKIYLENDCKENITNYRNATFEQSHVSYAVLDCLLEQFPEFRKVCSHRIPCINCSSVDKKWEI